MDNTKIEEYILPIETEAEDKGVISNGLKPVGEPQETSLELAETTETAEAAKETTDSKEKETRKAYDRGERSWFVVLNHPKRYFPEVADMTPEELCKWFCDLWVEQFGSNCACACALCVSAEGLEHIHFIGENPNKTTFYALKKFFRDSAHLEPTKGKKKQAEDYIYKRGAFAEKGEKVLYVHVLGEIAGAQGKRHDLEMVNDMIASGMTPNQIFRKDIKYRKDEKIIKDAYFDKRKQETPTWRPLNVIYHVGEHGSSKSYSVRMKYDEDEMLVVTDYESGFDKYNGQRVLLLEEFRGALKYQVLLTIMDNYKSEVHARYTNIVGLWDEVHITSPYGPEQVYRRMVKDSDQAVDSFGQLRRRLTTVIYHWKGIDGNYRQFSLSAKEYTDYSDLKLKAFHSLVQDEIHNEVLDVEALRHKCWESLLVSGRWYANLRCELSTFDYLLETHYSKYLTVLPSEEELPL